MPDPSEQWPPFARRVAEGRALPSPQRCATTSQFLGLADLRDPATFREGFPHAAFQRIREQDGLVWHPTTERGPGFWIAARHGDVVAVATDPMLSAEYLATDLDDPPSERHYERCRGVVLYDDGPTHRASRRRIAAGLAPHGWGGVEFVQRAVEIAVGPLMPAGPDAEGSPLEARTDFVRPLVASLIAEVAGVPVQHVHPIERPGDAAQLRHLAREQLAGDRGFVGRARAVDSDLTANLAFHDLWALMNAGVDTAVMATLNLLVTWAAYAGGVRDAFAEGGPGVLGRVFDESMRWNAGLMRIRRTARLPTRVAGTAVEAGERVVMYFPSANRDPLVFGDAEVFVPTRQPNPHVAFGFGAHRCLGAAFARLLGESLLGLAAQAEIYPVVDEIGPPLKSTFQLEPSYLKVRWVRW